VEHKQPTPKHWQQKQSKRSKKDARERRRRAGSFNITTDIEIFKNSFRWFPMLLLLSLPLLCLLWRKEYDDVWSLRTIHHHEWNGVISAIDTAGRSSSVYTHKELPIVPKSLNA
jgi:hypothetical protein